MTRQLEPDDKIRSEQQTGIPVWDLFIRFFHWSLLALVCLAAFTGFLGEEWWLNYHIWAGYAIGLLVVMRLVWGFVGSPFARFSSFVFSKQQTLSFVRQLLKGRPPRHTGHNPAGALMVFALLLVLSGLVLSGLVLLGGQENQGPLAGLIPYFIGAAFGEFHEFLAALLLFMIGAHIAGVIVESRLGGENLVRAMLTGKKRFSLPGHETAYAKRKAALVAIAICGTIGLAGAGAWRSLATIHPGGLPKMPENVAWKSECGDCHYAYHPSLLPGKSWQMLMAGLASHFGEDASLDEKTRREISSWLQKHAAEHWDTEAANNLRHISAEQPLRITASPWWKRRHAEVGKAVFARKSIGSRGNCIACHRDADSGRFDDQKINIPEK